MPPLSPVRQSSWTAASIGLARPIVARGRLSCSAFAAGLQRFVPNEEHNDWFLRLKAAPAIADARSDVAKATTFSESKRQVGLLRMLQAGVILSD